MSPVQNRTARPAVSLLELLVVIAIFAVMLGLLLSAIQNTRRAAQRVKNLNNLRQINLATHNFADSNDGRLPAIVQPVGSGYTGLFYLILPHIEQGNLYRDAVRGGQLHRIHLFVNPEDPTISLENISIAACSYAANAQLFFDGPRFTSITDGTSNTIAFAEHYAQCQGENFSWTIAHDFISGHRATFAETDKMGFPVAPDVYPVTKGNPPVSYASVGGWTFQAGPPVDKCAAWVAQSSNPAGMEIALADGSVRLINPAIAETVYWALVTPRGGEVIPDY